MESKKNEKQTAVMWLLSRYVNDTFLTPEMFQQALAMEKEQHGATWDAALIQSDKRGGVLVRAVCDFDEYWDNKNKNSNGA
jgi:hypothetical protein